MPNGMSFENTIDYSKTALKYYQKNHAKGKYNLDFPIVNAHNQSLIKILVGIMQIHISHYKIIIPSEKYTQIIISKIHIFNEHSTNP